MSKAILDERSKGEFKDWADFQKRVKGVGEKKAVKLSEAGLQVNGKGREGAAASATKPEKSAEKSAKAATGAKEAAAKPAGTKATM
jgi:competence protein ComEA